MTAAFFPVKTDMGYRYCPDCEKWLETSEYTVSESGETICPDHKAVQGFLDGSPHANSNDISSWYDDRDQMVGAAREQNLI